MSTLYLTEFAQELHTLIERHVDKDVLPEDLVDEMTRQLNTVFGKYNVEYRVLPKDRPAA